MLSILKFISKTFFLLTALFVFSNLPASAFPHFDYDNKMDFAVFRPGDRHWHSFSSEYESHSAMQWGLATDVLVPGDYDGDKRADVAVFRRGTWFIRQSSNGQMSVFNFGAPDDIPVNSLTVKESVAAIP